MSGGEEEVRAWCTERRSAVLACPGLCWLCAESALRETFEPTQHVADRSFRPAAGSDVAGSGVVLLELARRWDRRRRRRLLADTGAAACRMCRLLHADAMLSRFIRMLVFCIGEWSAASRREEVGRASSSIFDLSSHRDATCALATKGRRRLTRSCGAHRCSSRGTTCTLLRLRAALGSVLGGHAYRREEDEAPAGGDAGSLAIIRTEEELLGLPTSKVRRLEFESPPDE